MQVNLFNTSWPWLQMDSDEIQTELIEMLAKTEEMEKVPRKIIEE